MYGSDKTIEMNAYTGTNDRDYGGLKVGDTLLPGCTLKNISTDSGESDSHFDLVFLGQVLALSMGI